MENHLMKVEQVFGLCYIEKHYTNRGNGKRMNNGKQKRLAENL